MSAVNYLLLYQGYSNQCGHDYKVRSFAKLEAAQCAMEKSYREMAASMDIPLSAQTPSNRYTVRTKSSIRLERYGIASSGRSSKLCRRTDLTAPAKAANGMGCGSTP